VPKANKEPKTSSQQGQVTGREHGSRRPKRNWPHNKAGDSTRTQKPPWKIPICAKVKLLQICWQCQNTHTKQEKNEITEFFSGPKCRDRSKGKRKALG